jgi:hypothetical protein
MAIWVQLPAPSPRSYELILIVFTFLFFIKRKAFKYNLEKSTCSVIKNMSSIGITHAITGEQVGDTIETGDKTVGELCEELLPRMLKEGAVIDWKKLFYEKCEDIVSLEMEIKGLKQQKEELQEENNNHIQEKVAMWCKKERAIEEIDKLKEVIDELKVKR